MVGFINEENGTSYAGKHLLIDFFDCGNKEENLKEIEEAMICAAKATGATVLFSHIHPFDGGGSSGAVILAESHITFHRWHEENFLAIDIFVCGECNPYFAIPILKEYFIPTYTSIKLEKRGVINEKS